MRFRKFDPEEFNKLTGLAALKAKCFFSDLAPEVGLTPAALKKWTNVPGEMVIKLSEITDIPPHVLRPDLYDGYVAMKILKTVPGDMVTALSDLTRIPPHVLRPDLYAGYEPAARSATPPVMDVEK
jgi:hypothetical protein